MKKAKHFALAAILVGGMSLVGCSSQEKKEEVVSVAPALEAPKPQVTVAENTATSPNLGASSAGNAR